MTSYNCDMSFNKLLERQIKKYLPEDYYLQEDLARFIQAVHDSYEEYEKGRKLFNHAFACSEQEYIEINEKLKREATLKHASIQQLKETINKFKGTNTLAYNDTDDLSDVINYLEHELQEKKKADDLLQQSEKRLRMALSTIDDNVWEYNFLTRTMTFAVNEKSILELDSNVFEGKENTIWWQAIVEEDRHAPVETFRQYMSGEITKHCIEYRVKLKDGGTKWILNRGGVISKTKSGKPETVIGTLTDIQNYKNIQDELIATANRLSHLLINLQTGVLLEDENGKVVLTNKKFTEFFAYPGSPETLVGIECTELYESSTGLFKYPDEFLNNTDKYLKERKPVNNEELKMADGRVLERNYIPLFIDDVYRGHLWTYNDITERKRSEIKLKKQEEKYRSIIANMNLGLIEVDLEENIRYVNHSFCLMSDYEEHELIGQNASRLFVKDENKELIEEKNSLRQKGLSDAYEMNVKTKNSDTKWWLVCGAPLYNDKQQLIGSIGIHLDITQQKILEQQLIEAKQIAEKSVHAKDLFLANMSHEIRTPMNAILGMSKQLQKTTLNQQQQSFLEIIGTAAENLLVIINDILDFSKLEAGKLQIDNTPFRIDELVEETIDIVTVKAFEKKLEMICHIDPLLPSRVSGDPVRIRQVFVNLLGNAIKFTQKGEIFVSLKKASSMYVKDGKKFIDIDLSVRDTGIGIPKEKLIKIFDSFTQADSSTTRKYGGTGLGLTISKSLAELMDGNLSVESEAGKGSTFTLRLPLEIVNSEPQITAAYRPPLQKVLIIDDNATNRWLMQEIFRYFSIPCETASSGREALEILQRIHKNGEPLDLILTDHHMPEMDGIQLVQEIRKSLKGYEQAIILMLSSIEKNMFQRQAEKLGIHSFLSKPVKLYELYALLSAMFTTGKQQPEKIITIPTIEKIADAAVIMVVEDEPINMLLITEVLGKMGFVVIKATNGKQALEILQQQDPQLIFMDVNMPEMDGFTTTRLIRQLPEPYSLIPVIALTADAMQGDKEKCIEAGMNDYISKPFKLEEIEAVLKKRMLLV